MLPRQRIWNLLHRFSGCFFEASTVLVKGLGEEISSSIWLEQSTYKFVELTDSSSNTQQTITLLAFASREHHVVRKKYTDCRWQTVPQQLCLHTTWYWLCESADWGTSATCCVCQPRTLCDAPCWPLWREARTTRRVASSVTARPRLEALSLDRSAWRAKVSLLTWTANFHSASALMLYHRTLVVYHE